MVARAEPEDMLMYLSAFMVNDIWTMDAERFPFFLCYVLQTIHITSVAAEKYRAFFEMASCVVIERQMRCNMRIVEAVLQSMFYPVCTVINARSVKAHYNLGTRNYRMNKQRAVAWAEQFVQANPHAFQTGVTVPFTAKHKKDDLADSLLLVTYYLDTYSNQLSESEPFNLPPDGVI